ncbi:MAG TPA: NAD(P)-dependent alcohol dehydrogenase [Stellaceae bacterium]|nr:NAD(P)-dependent alcohol dehydrogenase [Stellaceae bacterium]
MRAYKLTRDGDRIRPILTDTPLAPPGPGEVRVRLEAASLNYRDLIVLDGAGSSGAAGRIPLSDAAGRVEALGAQVTRWRPGDRVAASFFRDWIKGPFQAEYLKSALGGSVTDGVLTESIILPEAALVAVPGYLSMIEAATLPCAAVTAWQALITRGGLAAGGTLLVQGTGGVALFALQFARSMGARAIVLSSSDAKLDRAREMGASILINYRRVPEWDKAVLEATEGKGVDCVLELGGPDTYDRSVRVVAAGGKIAQIGVLTGFGPQPNLGRLQSMNADILGITVGSVAHFEAMNHYLEEKRITPVIDRIFDFEDAADAYDYLRSGAHFGKIVVRI